MTKIIVGLTQTAKTNFQNWLNDCTNDTYGSFDAVERFNTIWAFNDDNTARYEHSRYYTKSGNPEIYDFEAVDFEYEEVSE